MDLSKTLQLSAQGMVAQSSRLQVIAQNLANTDTTGSTPGSDPYRRKTVTFTNTLDQQLNTTSVSVKSVQQDMSAFPTRYDPSSPAADANGYVKLPNVSSFTEVMDMKEAQRSYSANMSVMETTRGMMSRTIDLLK
jgi:flagellar basal-body rod protein FlgC